MKLLANNQIPAYEYLDGREIFTDEYRIKVREMFDRFHILYAEAKGYSEKNPRFTIEESDIPPTRYSRTTFWKNGFSTAAPRR